MPKKSTKPTKPKAKHIAYTILTVCASLTFAAGHGTVSPKAALQAALKAAPVEPTQPLCIWDGHRFSEGAIYKPANGAALECDATQDPHRLVWHLKAKN